MNFPRGSHGFHTGFPRDSHGIPTGFPELSKVPTNAPVSFADGPWFDSGWPDLHRVAAKTILEDRVTRVFWLLGSEDPLGFAWDPL